MDKIKIKTLEEFDSFDELNPRFVNRDHLRLEAIKLLKENKRAVYCTICEGFNCDCSSSDCFKISHWDDVFTFIRYFYRITAKELTAKTERGGKDGK